MERVEDLTPAARTLLAAFDGEALLADLDALGAIGWQPGAGITRLAYSGADLAGRDWVLAQMQALGMTATIDPAGNVIGLYGGAENLPALAIGSHTDSVPESGKFDGALGVVGALACVRTLHDQGVRLRHPLLVIDFAAEEATTAASPMGSLSLIGKLTRADLGGPAWDGRSTLALLQDSGFWVERMLDNRPPLPLAAFVELHIEQGERLADAGIPIGVVEGIVGIRRYYVTFTGQANHAGTTGMARRRDALVMAAPFIVAVQEIAVAHGIVGTVGRVEVHPGAPNVIPGRVVLEVEIRGMDNGVLDAAAAALQARATAAGGQVAAGHRMEPIWADADLRATIADTCTALGLPYLHLPSGAGHDAMNMAEICPIGMIFVPSEGGVSHAPDEFTQARHCIDGGRLLLATLLELDKRL
jgi:N-carbamoyl-L-amino-acid hydrolase